MINVLIADDHAMLRKGVRETIEEEIGSVSFGEAQNAREVIGQIQEKKWDIILLDIEMPRMDGYELATHMRNDERFKNIPNIMITSRTGEKHRNRAMEIGVNKYLGKPYQEAELLETIQELVGTFNPQRTSW